MDKATDLGKASGLPLKLMAGNRLGFGKGMDKTEPDIRTRERMKDVLKNPNVESPPEFYYMYRNLKLEKHAARINAARIRYDITILPPFSIGGEHNKTFGHYHPKVPGTDTWYPEIYEVLAGRAHYLLQNNEEFLVYDARPGDKCLMLPGFAHATVNPSPTETLVMANWVCPEFESDYTPIQEKKGMQYYETQHGFVPNKNYETTAHIKLAEPRQLPALGLTKKPVYSEAMKTPKKFEWLWRPQDYTTLFDEYRGEK